MENNFDSPELPPEMVSRVLGRRSFLIRSGLTLASALLWNRMMAAEAAAVASVYVVKSGDTLSEIAARHGLTVKQLKEFNDLQGDRIFPKQELRLTAGKETFTRLKPVMAKIDAPKPSTRWKNIIVHHSATTVGNAAIFHRYHLQERHMENGLAYHFVIGNGHDSRNGQVEVGGRWTKQLAGGHVKSFAYNENSIGICLVGNFQVKRPSSLQLSAARQLITYLREHVLNKDVRFLVHRDIEKTLCPGRYFPISEFHKQFA